MPFVEQIKEKIYKKNSEITGRPKDPESLNPQITPIKKSDYTKWQNPPQFGLAAKTKKYIKIFLIFSVLAIVAYYGINMYLEHISFSVDKINLILNGPENLTSGAMALWQVTITNTNRGPLEDVELVFKFPEGSYVQGTGLIKEQKGNEAKLSLYTINSKETVKKEFKARIVAPANSLRVAEATIYFKPKGVTREIKKTSKFTTTIGNFPVIITVEAPNESFPNKEIFYKINYFNSSSNSFSDMRIKIQYPNGFDPRELWPEPSEGNNIWKINNLSPAQEGQIKIHGILKGEENERKTIMVLIEGQNEENQYVTFTKEIASTNIISSPLALEVKVQGKENASVNVGEVVRYDIKFQNNFDVALQDLYIHAKLDGSMFDLSSLKTNGDFKIDTISWSAREIPELKSLKPGASGWASFEIKLKNQFTILSFNDKNFSVKVSVSIETKVVPPLLAGKEIKQSVDVISKINTKLELRATAFYRENSSSIQNFGPIPPRVGQTTTFTLHWQIINVSNDVEDLVVTSSLPTGVEWTGVFNANFKKEGLTFDPATKRITWNVGKVPARTGIANGLPVYEAVFQVAINPGPHQIHQNVALLDKSFAKAKDSFTGTNIEVSAPPKSVASLDDISIKGESRTVKP